MSKGKSPDQLTVAQLVKIVDMEKAIVDYFKQAKAELRKRLVAGESSPEFHVESVKGNRAWQDEAEAEKSLRAIGFTKKSLTKVTMLSPAQVEQLPLPKKAEKDQVGVVILDQLADRDPVHKLKRGPAPEKVEGVMKHIFEGKE